MEIQRLVLGDLATNCYVQKLNDTHCIIVDIGAGAPVLLRFLASKQLTPVAILLTHGHYDHTAGVEMVREKFDIPVYIHEMDVPMLSDKDRSLAVWLSQDPFQPVQAWQTVADQTVLTFEGVTFQVLHTPGHTPGSVCWLSGDALYTGDTLFHLSRGRTDFPGGSDAQMLDSFRRLKALEGDYRVLPGHNETSSLAFEKKHNPMMRGV